MQNYVTKIFLFEIYVIGIKFVSNQKFDMHFLNKHANALSSEPQLLVLVKHK